MELLLQTGGYINQQQFIADIYLNSTKQDMQENS